MEKIVSKKIIIAGEESAFHLKEKLVKFMEEKGYDFTDATSTPTMTYMEVGSVVGKAVSSGEYELGVVVCGSGMGVNLVANRYSGVYCGLVESYDTAKMARTITNCNVLAMGGNVVAYDLACRMLEVFVETEFTEGFDKEKAETLQGYFKQMKELDSSLHTS